MSTVGQKEILTQKHVIRFFQDELDYDYLGYWKEREGNSNVEEPLLADWLKRQGHSGRIITKVLHAMDKAKTLGGGKTLYDANREVYGLLRYGVKVKPDVGEQHLTVWLIDWKTPDNNDFAIAEEVTVFGVHTKRPDIVLYVNGIVWHTQGSGKSLTMVWLAKWVREHITDARVLLITDRTELDEQIEQVFKGVDEDIYRTQSGADLVRIINATDKWLICSLVHKFGRSEEGDVDAYLQDIQSHLPKGFHPKGELFVFVDECHRTQSGKLHQAMKAIVPGAMLIGFTGTPLLKRDKQKSIEVFGPYIHTYKYDEAVRDGVVLDLRYEARDIDQGQRRPRYRTLGRYEARDIDQNITSQARIDQWFEIKTQGLTDLAKAQLKQRWGTCNIETRRIWLNLELAKKPASCLEYILVHEMVHLLERRHNERFRELMDGLMPQWPLHREELNRAPLAHEEWIY